MKQYKHKKLGWIANEGEGSYFFNTPRDNELGTSTYVPKELIEESNDRELIEEKDWIDDMYNDLGISRGRTNINKENIRKCINKHLPKITEEELDTLYSHKIGIGGMEFVSRENLKNLLKSKGLLAE